MGVDASVTEEVAVFAPKVAKPQTKVVDSSTTRLAAHRSTLVGHRLGEDPVALGLFPERTISDQAMLRKLVRRSSGRAGSGRNSREELARVGENTPIQPRNRGVSQDFSKVALFPTERASRVQPVSVGHAQPGLIWPKLAIGPVDDPLEREADAVADWVMRMADPAPSISTAPERISRKCADCDMDKEKNKPQAKSAGEAKTVGEAPSVVHEVLRAPGRPLDRGARAFFETRFGADFGNVRIHDGADAVTSARAIGALAFAVGPHLVFGRGQYAPGSNAGRKLLSHELMHVVQMGQHASQGQQVWRQASPDVEGATIDQTALSAGEEASPLAGVDPSGFSFHTVIPDDGTGVSGGWQETDCETVRFVGGFPFFPTKIDVQLRVGVPLRNQRQGVITPVRAHNESVDAANLAGTEVIGLLLDGDISPSQVPSYFIGLMQTHLLIDGRRVTTCTGGSKKAALFAVNDSGSGGSMELSQGDSSSPTASGEGDQNEGNADVSEAVPS